MSFLKSCLPTSVTSSFTWSSLLMKLPTSLDFWLREPFIPMASVWVSDNPHTHCVCRQGSVWTWTASVRFSAVNCLLIWSSNALALFKINTLDFLLHQVPSLKFLESVINFWWCIFFLIFPSWGNLLHGHPYIFPWPCVLRHQSETWLTAGFLPSWHNLQSCPHPPHPPPASWPRSWAKIRHLQHDGGFQAHNQAGEGSYMPQY